MGMNAPSQKPCQNLSCSNMLLILFTNDAASEDESTVPPRRLLVFVNPVGGQGKAVKEFEQHVQPLFDLAEIEYTTIITGEWMTS